MAFLAVLVGIALWVFGTGVLIPVGIALCIGGAVLIIAFIAEMIG